MALRKETFKFDSTFVDYDLAPYSYCKEAEVEWCCGASILGNFPADSESRIIKDIKEEWDSQVSDWMSGQYDYNYKRICIRLRPKKPSDSYFKKLYTDKIKDSVRDTMGKTKGHLHIAILIPSQLWIKPVLLSVGFRQVSDRTVNSNSKNRMYVFIRDPVTPKGSKLKKKVF